MAGSVAGKAASGLGRFGWFARRRRVVHGSYAALVTPPPAGCRGHLASVLSPHEEGGGPNRHPGAGRLPVGTRIQVRAPRVVVRRGGRSRSGLAPARGRGNDPSAGSPTETLLRLHLPLNDKV